eukprot:5382719-Alexandrium_andersonii.AAC.1
MKSTAPRLTQARPWRAAQRTKHRRGPSCGASSRRPPLRGSGRSEGSSVTEGALPEPQGPRVGALGA